MTRLSVLLPAAALACALLAGLPALVVPVGDVGGGLTAAVQLVAAPVDEASLWAAARALR